MAWILDDIIWVLFPEEEPFMLADNPGWKESHPLSTKDWEALDQRIVEPPNNTLTLFLPGKKIDGESVDITDDKPITEGFVLRFLMKYVKKISEEVIAEHLAETKSDPEYRKELEQAADEYNCSIRDAILIERFGKVYFEGFDKNPDGSWSLNIGT